MPKETHGRWRPKLNFGTRQTWSCPFARVATRVRICRLPGVPVIRRSSWVWFRLINQIPEKVSEERNTDVKKQQGLEFQFL